MKQVNIESQEFSIPSEFKQPETDTPVEQTTKRNRVDNLRKKPKDDKPVLSKVNRILICPFCDQERILNPEQYQAYFDYWGDEEKIKRNFVCKPCEVAQNENPFAFWVDHHELIKKLSRAVKEVFGKYNASQKTTPDVVNLQNDTTSVLMNNKIDPDKVNYIRQTENDPMTNIVGINFNMPFVGAINIRPFEIKKIILL